MTFSDKQIADLSAKLDPANVATRQQSGRSLSYIEGWHAEAEANRIFGFDGWSTETVWVKCVAERERTVGRENKPGWGVTYTCQVRVTVGGVVREGVGAGHGIDVDLGLAHESAVKEAATDAEKRALKTFGNVFGLALYDKSQANVGTSGRKSSAQAKRDKDDERIKAAIDSCADLEALGAWGAKFDEHTAQLPHSWLEPIHDHYLKRRDDLLVVQRGREAA